MSTVGFKSFTKFEYGKILRGEALQFKILHRGFYSKDFIPFFDSNIFKLLIDRKKKCSDLMVKRNVMWISRDFEITFDHLVDTIVAIGYSDKSSTNLIYITWSGLTEVFYYYYVIEVNEEASRLFEAMKSMLEISGKVTIQANIRSYQFVCITKFSSKLLQL